MALVKFGNGVAAISGKIDGTVFSRVRGGAVARGWTMPVNAPTASQAALRSQFATVSWEWNNITAAQRSQWNAQAVTAERTNRLGETYTPSGRQLFMELNKNLSLVGSALIAPPPPSWNRPSPPVLVAGDASQTAGLLTAFTLDVTAPSGTPAGTKYLVEMTPPYAPDGKTNLTNLYRTIAFGVAPAVAVDILDLYDSIFGSVAALGTGISMRGFLIDAFGNRSTFLEAKLEVS